MFPFKTFADIVHLSFKSLKCGKNDEIDFYDSKVQLFLRIILTWSDRAGDLQYFSRSRPYVLPLSKWHYQRFVPQLNINELSDVSDLMALHKEDLAKNNRKNMPLSSKIRTDLLNRQAKKTTNVTDAWSLHYRCLFSGVLWLVIDEQSCPWYGFCPHWNGPPNLIKCPNKVHRIAVEFKCANEHHTKVRLALDAVVSKAQRTHLDEELKEQNDGIMPFDMDKMTSSMSRIIRLLAACGILMGFGSRIVTYDGAFQSVALATHLKIRYGIDTLGPSKTCSALSMFSIARDAELDFDQLLVAESSYGDSIPFGPQLETPTLKIRKKLAESLLESHPTLDKQFFSDKFDHFNAGMVVTRKSYEQILAYIYSKKGKIPLYHYISGTHALLTTFTADSTTNLIKSSTLPKIVHSSESERFGSQVCALRALYKRSFNACDLQNRSSRRLGFNKNITLNWDIKLIQMLSQTALDNALRIFRFYYSGVSTWENARMEFIEHGTKVVIDDNEAKAALFIKKKATTMARLYSPQFAQAIAEINLAFDVQKARKIRKNNSSHNNPPNHHRLECYNLTCPLLSTNPEIKKANSVLPVGFCTICPSSVKPWLRCWLCHVKHTYRKHSIGLNFYTQFNLWLDQDE